MPELLRLRASADEARGGKLDTAVIYLELAGGPTQHETYDPKPDAPAEYRGPLNSIKTALPGVHFSQYMEKQAAIARGGAAAQERKRACLAAMQQVLPPSVREAEAASRNA